MPRTFTLSARFLFVSYSGKTFASPSVLLALNASSMSTPVSPSADALSAATMTMSQFVVSNGWAQQGRALDCAFPKCPIDVQLCSSSSAHPGSDGTINYTFRNMCFLKYEACQNRAEMTVVGNRPCGEYPKVAFSELSFK